MTTPATTTPGKCGGEYWKSGSCKDATGVTEEKPWRETLFHSCSNYSDKDMCNKQIGINLPQMETYLQEQEQSPGRLAILRYARVPGIQYGSSITPMGSSSPNIGETIECNGYSQGWGAQCSGPWKYTYKNAGYDHEMPIQVIPICEYVRTDRTSCSNLTEVDCKSKQNNNEGCTRTPATSTPAKKEVKCIGQDSNPLDESECEPTKKATVEKDCGTSTPSTPPTTPTCTPGEKDEERDSDNPCNVRIRTCTNDKKRGPWQEHEIAKQPMPNAYCQNKTFIYCGAEGLIDRDGYCRCSNNTKRYEGVEWLGDFNEELYKPKLKQMLEKALRGQYSEIRHFPAGTHYCEDRYPGSLP